MIRYREILRLSNLNISQKSIAEICKCSKKTVNRVLKTAKELNISWPLDDNETDLSLSKKLFIHDNRKSDKQLPDYEYIRKELQKNGVNKKLLWTEYLETCRLSNASPLMYSQFCYYIRQEALKYHATMHIARKPAEQTEVDWAGDPAIIIDPDTGETFNVWLFVGVLTYSNYPYVEAFFDQKKESWIQAHVNMFEYFGGVTHIIVPDNCKTAVINANQYDIKINSTYQELAEFYNTAIIPARVRSPKDKPNVEGTVGKISTWITAALRNEKFFSLSDLNKAIKIKLKEFSEKPFQKKDGSRYDIFVNEEKDLLTKLPQSRFEISEWKRVTVQFNYHIYIDSMYYSVPSEYIKKEVDVKLTKNIVEIYYNHNRIASHRRLYGKKSQYSTIESHMPLNHKLFLEYNGEQIRNKAKEMGDAVYIVIESLLKANVVEKKSYKSCIAILKLAEKYSISTLNASCKKALSFTQTPGLKMIKMIIETKIYNNEETENIESSNETNSGISNEEKSIEENGHAMTRGAEYYTR